jgi:hypothetical protein
MSDNIIPVVAIFIIFGAPIGAWIVTRVLAHQERMEMLRRGFVPPPDAHAMHHAARMGMRGGWMPGPPPGTSMPPGASVPPPGWKPHAYDPAYHAQAHLRKGVQIAFVGLALLIGLSFIGHSHGNFIFGPWLLGGLIPLFVGVAQIITAIMGGAQFGRLTMSCDASGYVSPEAPHSVGSQQATSAGPSGPPPPPSSYGGWRPGNMPEIEPPAPPPERR